MVHQPSGGVQGQATDIQIQAEEIIKMRSQLNGIYSKHTGQPLSILEPMMERDRFMTPDQAKGRSGNELLVKIDLKPWRWATLVNC